MIADHMSAPVEATVRAVNADGSFRVLRPLPSTDPALERLLRRAPEAAFGAYPQPDLGADSVRLVTHSAERVPSKRRLRALRM